MATATPTIPQGEQTSSGTASESTCHLINAPQCPHMVCDGPAWLDSVGKSPL